MADLSEWLRKELPKVLQGIVVGEDAIEYILTMTSFEEVEDYISDLITEPNSRTKRFLAQLRHRWLLCTELTEYPPPDVKSRQSVSMETKNIDEGVSNSKLESKPNQLSSSPSPLREEQAYKKARQEDLVYFSVGSSKKDGKQTRNKSEASPQSTLPVEESPVYPRGAVNEKKQKKYVPLNSSKGQAKTTVHLPGRHACECLAQKHPLVNNCIECGRIVCQQEGCGPCLTCGAFVCTSEDQAVLARNSKKSTKHKQILMKHHNIQVPSGALLATDPNTDSSQHDRAITHKDKLLEYDKSSVRRTKVIDDESDYFTSSNQWLTEKERGHLKQREEELRQSRYGSRLSRKMTFDFAGRQIVEEEPIVDIYHERHVTDLIDENLDAMYTPPPLNPNVDQESLVNPTISSSPPKFVMNKKEPKSKRDAKSKKDVSNLKTSRVVRVQDRQLQEMRDEGKCLSMHQPWASLLVLGIKRVEGRVWYTSHRGKLWIASTVTTPSSETILAVEQQYKELHNDPNLEYPNEYPCGKLLGAVDVVDCLAQEDFQLQVCGNKYDSRESSSPFVLVVDHPCCLSKPIPVKGQHKIWKLPVDVHSSARRHLKSPTVSLVQ